MIVANDCLILRIFQMGDGERREEVPMDVMNHQQAEREAASVAYRVGYRDTSHFNREYKSLFGVPPMRDVQRLREEAQVSAGR